MRVIPLVAGLLVFAGPRLAGQARRDPPSGADPAAIRAIRERSNDAIARHDTAGIGAVLAPEVVVLTSTSVMVIGRDANVKLFADQFAARPDVVYRRAPVEIRIEPVWRMASERGNWVGRWTGADGPVTISGSYFAKWRRVEGDWLIESETYVPERCEGGAYCRTPPR